MGAYNAEFRKLDIIKGELRRKVENYKKVATYALDKLLCEIRINPSDMEEFGELYSSYSEMVENYKSELDRLRIKTNGEFYYNEIICETKSDIIEAINVHLEMLSNILDTAFGEILVVGEIHKEYSDFLRELLLVICK